MSVPKGACEVPQGEFARSRMLEDLHLAAELGKTLLDRNKELELLIRDKQSTIEDQKLEIEYLTKQTVALKEVNDSRLRIYEQLEVSIQDLERSNHRLQFENSTEKKHIKSLKTTIEQLETKCEELQSTIDDLRIQVDILRKKTVRNSDVGLPKSANTPEVVTLRHVTVNDGHETTTNTDTEPSTVVQKDEVKCTTPAEPQIRQPEHEEKQSSIQTEPECDQNQMDEMDSNRVEELTYLMAQLRECKARCSRDERIIFELEEQLAAVIKQNQALENQVIQLSHQDDDLNMKSMHEEFRTLEEVRLGQMCSKCLRGLDQSSEALEEDDQSLLDELAASQHRTSFSMNVQDHANNQSSPVPAESPSNPYKLLVEKYEALVEVHRNPIRSSKTEEELQMSGDFNPNVTKDTDEESGHDGSLRAAGKRKQPRKAFATPTDFSEAETSSSGFADETSNKGTQTEGRVGSFLCTIADGEDCKFSIYDDASPLDSRFRDRPEYRDLFKEIFRVLKKAAENKADGEDLPLLDDRDKTAPVVPPVTPMNEQPAQEFPDDDTQSIMSSTMSEFSTQNEPTVIIENIVQAQNQPIPEGAAAQSEPTKQERVLIPLVRQRPLDFISVEVNKRSSSKRRNKGHVQRSEIQATHIIGSPKITYTSRPNSGKKKRDKQNASTDENWHGNTLQFWATKVVCPSPTPSQGSGRGYLDYKPSMASRGLNKLKELDMSYAEVLRKASLQKQLYKQQQRRK